MAERINMAEGSSNAGPETGSSQPSPETPQATLNRVTEAAATLTSPGALSPEQIAQRKQAIKTVLGGVIELHKQGVIGRDEAVRNTLQQDVFTADPQRKILADGLVANIEAAANINLRAVPQLLELSSLLGINDKNKYPDLAERIDRMAVKTDPAEKPKTKERTPRRKKSVVQKGPSSDDFIPLAKEVEPEEPDVTQNALLVALGDIIGYLPDTPDNREMLGQASKDDPQALLRLARLAASRGYLERTVQNLTRLITYSPERAEEIIPILKALSVSDPNNPGVYQLLGDSYLQLGEHIEAITAYREVLKIPPKE